MSGNEKRKVVSLRTVTLQFSSVRQLSDPSHVVVVAHDVSRGERHQSEGQSVGATGSQQRHRRQTSLALSGLFSFADVGRSEIKTRRSHRSVKQVHSHALKYHMAGEDETKR